MAMLNVRALIRKRGIQPKKSLGQNFLVSERGLKAILEAIEPGSEDVVIEIGAGLGNLTVPLAEKAGRVIAVEIDQALVEVLREACKGYSNVYIVQGDILALPPEALLEETEGEAGPFKVAGNLPYYITSAILRHFLEAPLKPSLMVVTVQREVAQKITALPGQMSLLSVSVQLYAQPRIICHLPPEAFYPPPEVDSTVLRLDIRPTPLIEVDDEKGFFQVVRAGFSERRKMLRNSLKRGLGLPGDVIERSLREAGIDPRRRAQSLSLEEWGELFRCLKPFLEKGR